MKTDETTQKERTMTHGTKNQRRNYIIERERLFCNKNARKIKQHSQDMLRNRLRRLHGMQLFCMYARE